MKTPVSDSPETMTESHPAYSRGSDQRVAEADVARITPSNTTNQLAAQSKGAGGYLNNPKAMVDPKVKVLPIGPR